MPMFFFGLRVCPNSIIFGPKIPTSIEIHRKIHSLKLTAKAPENGWLEFDRFLLGWPIFRDELLVSGRVAPIEMDLRFLWAMPLAWSI